MNYGLPYMGSKNLIAKTIIDALPCASTFVDLFAGGCAITHAAMLSNKYQAFIANDLSDTPQLFLDAVAGKFENERRWISREDFFALKDSDPYVRTVWSFGNNGKNYMYSREVEPWKRALHYARVLDDLSPMREFGIDTDGSSADIRAHHDEYKLKYTSWYRENVSLERLQRLQSLQRLQVYRLDYRDVKIPAGSLVYADPPYRGTASYVCGVFNHDVFYEWCLEQPFDIYISEYSMPTDFHEVLAIRHRSRLCANAKNAVVERLYCNHPRTMLGQFDFLGQLFAEAV